MSLYWEHDLILETENCPQSVCESRYVNREKDRERQTKRERYRERQKDRERMTEITKLDNRRK